MSQPSATSLDSGTTTTDASSYSTNAKTFTAGKLYLIHVKVTIASGTPNAPTSVKFHTAGTAWTAISSAAVGTTGARLDAYVIIPASTLSSEKVDVDYGAQSITGFDYVIDEITDFDASGTALTPILQAASTSGTSSSAPSVALASAPAVNSLTIGSVGTGNVTINVGTGFSTIASTAGHNNPGSKMNAEKDSGTPQQTAAWTTGSTNFVAHVIEIARGATVGSVAMTSVADMQIGSAARGRQGLSAAIGVANFAPSGARGRGGQQSLIGVGLLAATGDVLTPSDVISMVGVAHLSLVKMIWNHAALGDTIPVGAVDQSSDARAAMLSALNDFIFTSTTLASTDIQDPDGLTVSGVDIDENGWVWVTCSSGGTHHLLFSNDPTNHSGWFDASVDVTFADSPAAVLAGRDSSGRLPVVVVPGTGVYVRSSNVWTLVSGGPWAAAAPAGYTVQPAVQPGRTDPIIVLYDPNTGVWKSSDYAQHWFLLWTIPSEGPSAITMDMSGNLYLAAGGVLYIVAGANDPTAWDDSPPTVDNAGLTASILLTNVSTIGLS